MIIQKRICDNCKKEIEEREDCYYKTNITVINANGQNTSNSISGDYCKECFKDVCESIQKEEEKVVEA